MTRSDRKKRGHAARRHGREGERLVRNMFEAWDWVVREDVPDEGIDFNVEVPAGTGRPATRILVQVKSRSRMHSAKDGSWTISVRTSRVLEYQAHRQPVFIVAVDLSSGAARWVDVGNLAHATGIEISATKIAVPRSNVLNQLEVDAVFEASILVAMRRLDEKHYPPLLALDMRRAAQEEVDPRFSVSVDLVGGAERYTYTPREPVDLTLEFAVASREEKLALLDTWRFGAPTTVAADELKLDGSALFSSLPTRGKLSITGQSRSIRLCLGFRGEVDGNTRWIVDEKASAYIGREGGLITMQADGCPIGVELRLLTTVGKVAFKHVVDYGCWEGKDVRNLPFLRPIVDLFEGSTNAGTLLVGVREYGDVQTALEVPLEPRMKSWRELAFAFQCIAGLARTCNAMAVAFKWRPGIIQGRSEMEAWLGAGRLTDGQSVRMNYEGFSTALDASSPKPASDSERTTFVIRSTFEVTAWGEKVVDIPVLLRLTDYAVTMDETTRRLEVRRTPASMALLFFDRDPDDPPSEAILKENS